MRQAQTVGHGIIDRLNAFRNEKINISPFERASLIREIDKLKEANAVSGLMTFGIFYALCNEEERSIKSHELSLNAGGRDVVYLVNYATSLVHLLRFETGFYIYLEALQKSPGSREILMYMAELAVLGGFCSEFRDCLSTYLKATQDESVMEDERVRRALSLEKNLQSLDIAEHDAKATFSKVEAVFYKHKIRPVDVGSHINDADGHIYCSVEIKVNCSPAELVEMNDELSLLIAEDLTIESWNKLVYTFVYSGLNSNARSGQSAA